MSRTESQARSLNDELLRQLSTMRSTIKDSRLRCEFDRSFQECFSTFSVDDYIDNKGRISLEHTSNAIQLTFQQLSEYCVQQSLKIPSSEPERWTALSYTFWNPHLAALFQNITDRINQLCHVELVTPLSSLTIDPASSNPARATPVQQHHRTQTERAPKITHKSELTQLHSQLNSTVFIHPGKNQCRIQGCRGCVRIFEQAPLMRCRAVHPKTKPCTSTGWFPHLSSASWSRFKHIHLRPDFTFTGRHPTRDERYNPLRHTSFDERAIAEPSVQEEEIASPNNQSDPTNITPQCVESDDLTTGPQSWADEVQLAEDASRKRVPDPMQPVPRYKRRRPMHLDTM